MRSEVIPVIRDMLKTQKPKITTLTETEQKFYRSGLSMLGLCIPENFFDLPHLSNPHERFDLEGLFYSIPYFDDEQLWSIGGSQTSRTLLVVYKLENRSSWCPFRIEVVHSLLDDGEIDVNNFELVCHDQSGQRTVKRNIISRENGKLYTQIPNHESLTLSQLMDFTNHDPCSVTE